MTTIVKKALITLQDIAKGTGKVRQTRGGMTMELDEVPLFTSEEILGFHVKTPNAEIGRSLESRLQQLGGVFTTVDNLKSRRAEVGDGDIVRVHGNVTVFDGGQGWYQIVKAATNPGTGFISLGDDLYAKRGS